MTVRVRDYCLAVDLREEAVVSTVTTIRFTADTPDTYVDTSGLRVRSVRLNGVAVHSAPSGGRLALRDLATDNIVEISAVAGPPAVRSVVDQGGGHRSVSMGAEYMGAPNWFPNFPGGEFKAPMTFEVRCPTDWTVVGAGAESRSVLGDWRIRSERPLAAHLTGLAAGRFHTVRFHHDGMPVAFHVRAGAAGRLDRMAERLFAVTAACLDEYHRLFGVRLGLPACQFVFVPDVVWAALEYPGCVQLREDLLTGDTAFATVVLAHELAHLWFGHLVTPRRTGDVWLYEAIAEYLGRRVASAVAGESVVLGMAAGRDAAAYRTAQRGADDPLYRQSVPVDRVGYVKGAAALRDLRDRLGERIFLAGLRNVLDTRPDGAAGLGELTDGWSAAGGTGLEQWRRDWLVDRGIGVVMVQGRRLTAGAPVPNTVSLRAVDRDGHTLDRWDVQPVAGSAALPTVSAQTVLVLPEDGSWHYTRFTATQWRVVPGIAAGLGPGARAAVWTALRMAVSAGEIGAGHAVTVAAALLSAETDAALLDAGAAWTTGVLLWRHAVTGECRVAAALAGTFDTADADSDLQAIAGRHWIDVAPARPVRGLLTRADDTLRWRVLTRLAVLGEVDEATVLAEIGGAGGITAAAQCRAAIADPVAKEHVWRDLTTPHAMTVAQRVAAARMFWHPRHRQLTAPYVPRFFAALTSCPVAVAVLLARFGFPVTAPAGDVLDRTARLVGDTAVPQEVRSAAAAVAGELYHRAGHQPGCLAELRRRPCAP